MEATVYTTEPAPQFVDIIGLTLREAQLLRMLLRRVGGVPSGPRGRMEELLTVLEDAGINQDSPDAWVEGGLTMSRALRKSQKGQ